MQLYSLAVLLVVSSMTSVHAVPISPSPNAVTFTVSWRSDHTVPDPNLISSAQAWLSSSDPTATFPNTDDVRGAWNATSNSEWYHGEGLEQFERMYAPAIHTFLLQPAGTPMPDGSYANVGANVSDLVIVASNIKLEASNAVRFGIVGRL